MLSYQIHEMIAAQTLDIQSILKREYRNSLTRLVYPFEIDVKEKVKSTLLQITI